jgi:hypothetical protein
MRGAIPLLPQYAFMAWCSVNKSTGATLLCLPSVCLSPNCCLSTWISHSFGMYFLSVSWSVSDPGSPISNSVTQCSPVDAVHSVHSVQRDTDFHLYVKAFKVT